MAGRKKTERRKRGGGVRFLSCVVAQYDKSRAKLTGNVGTWQTWRKGQMGGNGEANRICFMTPTNLSHTHAQTLIYSRRCIQQKN